MTVVTRTRVEADQNSSSSPIPIRIDGQRTTVRLLKGEQEALERICRVTNVSVDTFCTSVANDPARIEPTLTAKLREAIVTYLLDQWQEQKA